MGCSMVVIDGCSWLLYKLLLAAMPLLLVVIWIAIGCYTGCTLVAIGGCYSGCYWFLCVLMTVVIWVAIGGC